jgi:regulator of protease activity HflC (stomatin/prohibitin superfamily)
VEKAQPGEVVDNGEEADAEAEEAEEADAEEADAEEADAEEAEEAEEAEAEAEACLSACVCRCGVFGVFGCCKEEGANDGEGEDVAGAISPLSDAHTRRR